MNRNKSKTVSDCRPKINAMTIIALFLLVLLSISRTRSDEICDAIVVDAITDLQNGSLVIFRKSDIWFLDQEKKELQGPCPIKQIFKEMTGPMDAALTISKHETITDFIGSSVYFENENFFTFKNLGPYEVEWGALTYLPHKGAQKDMGQSSPEALKYMEQTISYAYFDPIDLKSKLVFSDGSLLSFTFDMGAIYDQPELTTISAEMKKYGLEKTPRELTGAVALTNKATKETTLYLFNSSTFCAIKMGSKGLKQTCDMKPNKEFLNCDAVKRSNEMCLSSASTDKGDKPIDASVGGTIPVATNPKGTEGKSVQVRSDDQNNTNTKPGSGGTDSLTKNTLLLALTFIFIVFISII